MRPICWASAPLTVSPVRVKRLAHWGPTLYSHMLLGDIGPPRQAKAVNLRDHRLMHIENRHAEALRAFQLPGVIIDAAAAAVGAIRILHP